MIGDNLPPWEPAERLCGRRGCSNMVEHDYPYDWCQDCQNAKCDHGNPPHDCDECCRESDFEFDKQREQRFFQ